MPLTEEQHKLLIETATIVKGLKETMESTNGTPRCAKNMEKIATLEQGTKRTRQYAWAVILMVMSQFIYSIFR
jgi:hypothetical protein